MSVADASADELRGILERQKRAQLAEGAPGAERRIDRIDRAIGLLVDHKQEIAQALCEDFGHRSVHASLLTDISASIGPLKHARAHLRRWMRPEQRKVNPAVLGLLGARAGTIPAEGRGRDHQPVELPREPHLRAAGGRVRGRLSRHDQAQRVHAAHF
jgi:hypothetical protein